MPINAHTPFILVSGFHRSGTSLVAKTLSHNGVNMGNDLMGASFANSEGHYEDIPLVNIHDSMLAANGTTWQEYERLSLAAPEFLTEKLAHYLTLRQQNRDVLNGAKDPRALFFPTQWQASSRGDIKALFVFRSWQYSVSSLLKRHSRELIQTSSAMTTRPGDIVFWQQPELAAKMWIASAKAMLNWHNKTPANTLIFPLSALITGSEKLSCALMSIGLPQHLLDASAIVKKELLHTTIPQSMLDMIPIHIQRECDDLIAQLNAAFGEQFNEPVSLVNREPILKRTYLDQVGCESETLSRIPFIDLSKFTFDEAIKIVSAQSKDTASFNWDYLLNTMGETATDFDAIFNAALKHHKTIVAELAIRRAIEIQPASWRWMHLGDIQRNNGYLDQAEKSYLIAKQRTPGNSTFYARLAEIQILRKDFDTAGELIQQAKELDDTKPAIKQAETRLAIAASTSESTSDNDVTSNPSYQVMKVVSNYSDVVVAMTQCKAKGQILDEYMVKSAFVLRDNKEWLKKGLAQVPQVARACLLDYIEMHAKRYWPETVLRTEFASNPSDSLHQPINAIPTSDRQTKTNSPNLGVHLHVYYPHLLDEVYSFLTHLSMPLKVVITCPHEIKSSVSQRVVKQSNTLVIGVENRGRDIAPWLMHGAPQLRDCDLVIKLHTKSTPHASLLSGWRLQLLWSLLGDQASISNILCAFEQNKELGIVMPEYHPHIYPHINWGQNKPLVAELANRLNLDIDTSSPVLPFPAGSMFWYQPTKLAGLLDYPWQRDDFPEEEGQTDGTIMHAIERVLPYFCQTSFSTVPSS